MTTRWVASVKREPFPHDLAERAACRGSRVMFGVRAPSRKGGTDWSQARAICMSCPVRDACLAHAVANDEDEGMWGGLSPYEREQIAKGLVECPCGSVFPRRASGQPKVYCSNSCRRRAEYDRRTA